MKYNKILLAATVSALLLLFDGSAAPAPALKISFIAGEVKLNRAGKVFAASPGDPVLENDVLKVADRSMLKIEGADGLSVEIHGPRLFRYTAAVVGRLNENSGRLYTLLEKLSKKSVGYYPRTIVTAVRKGGNGKAPEYRDREAVEAMETLVRAVEKKDMERAKIALRRIESMDVSSFRKSGLMLLDYCRAEILFHDMLYDEALSHFLKIYKPGLTSFPYRQEAHAKAVICADLLGREVLRRELLGSYREVYGKEGDYLADLESLPGDTGMK